MGMFSSDKELYDIMGTFMQGASTHPEMGPKIRDSRIVIRFEYSDPEATITVDAKNPDDDKYFRVLFGPSDLKADVVMTMSADIAHRFWLGKVNLTAALTRGQMKAVGPISQIMKLLPAIKPAYSIYPEHLKALGRADLIL